MGENKKALLVIKSGDASGNKRFIIEDVISIGRDDKNDIIVPNLNVSRCHAKIRKIDDEQYRIEDQGSHNGTLLNGRLARNEILQHGDVINIADVEIEFQFSDTLDAGENKPKMTNEV